MPARRNGATRRTALTLLAASALMRSSRLGFAAAKTETVIMVINQSPWFESIRKLVDLYEKETGNRVELDVNPFAGSLEKQRNSVRSKDGQYDLLVMNSGWFAEMYFGGFVEAVTDIDPSFKLDPQLYTLGDTVFFDAQTKTMTPKGKLMSLPFAPIIPMLYYRGDLYKSAGLKVPDTFAELEANCRKLHKPPAIYGIVQRGARGPHTVAYDFYPYLYGFGGSIFKDQPIGDYSVTLNDEAGRSALDYYIRLAREAGHPKTASFDQAEVLQSFLTGKAAHVIAVIAAWSQMDDPDKSAIVDKAEYAPPPHSPGFPTAPALGHWLVGISRNVADGRKRGAVEFFRWFQTKDTQIALAKAGGMPVHAAAYEDPIVDERRFRWMKPLAAALPKAVNIYQFPEANEVIAILELGLNRAIAGETSSIDALNTMAGQIYDVMSRYGYRTAKLEPLR
jgi:multiple sugar transport system substrate-binding protein